MADERALELESRRRIYRSVELAPGTYLRELQRALEGMPMGMLEYHLRRLEEAGLVSVQEGEHKRFFPTAMGAHEKRYLGLLRQEACGRIVAHLIEHPEATRRALQEALGIPPTTLDHYLAKLVAAGIAERADEARPHKYALSDPTLARAVLVRHRPGFLDRVLDRVLDGIDAVQLRDDAER